MDASAMDGRAGERQAPWPPDGRSLAFFRATVVGLLFVIAAWAAAWPLYRAFLKVEIDVNEGWNAYFADAALGRMPLYPSGDQLITNNYPPLSFYVVGAVGKLVGDPVLAGRLLSLLSVAVLALTVARVVRRLGGDRASAAVGAAFFAATMCRFFDSYVGMNDPQLLGQAVMAVGFVAFLDATARDRGYVAPLLVMVLAGFIKHNIITMPLVAFVWLARCHPRRVLPCVAVGLAAVALGFALCFAAFGGDFLTNLTSPRAFSWHQSLGSVGELQRTVVGLTAWVYVGWARRALPGARLLNPFIGIALVVFFLQKGGAGVDRNAQFDLVIAVSIGVGLAFALAPSLPLARRFRPETLRTALLLALCVRLVASTQVEPIRLLFDPGLRTEIALRETALAQDVAHVRALPGNVLCDPLICYRAGKPFAVDPFNSNERIKAHKLPADALVGRLAAGTLTAVTRNPLGCWANAPGLNPAPAPRADHWPALGEAHAAGPAANP